jgi:hypothetical protein
LLHLLSIGAVISSEKMGEKYVCRVDEIGSGAGEGEVALTPLCREKGALPSAMHCSVPGGEVQPLA